MTNHCLPLLLLSFLVSCATPSQDEFEPDSVFDGMAFWIVSPFRNRPTYSFHWYGDMLRSRTPIDRRIEVNTLKVSECPGLKASLARLERTILETAEIAVGDREPLHTPDIVVDGPIYQLTYYPHMIGGSISLQTYESGDVPWIAAGLEVRQLSDGCSDS